MPTKIPHRQRRLESELQRTVSELLRREVDDPRIRLVTITAVKASPDLKHAKLFYTSLNSGSLDTGAARNTAAEVHALLEDAAHSLRGQVGRLLKLRVAPELVFQPDKQLEEGMRLTALIDKAVAADETRQAGVESTDSDDPVDSSSARSAAHDAED